MTDIPAIRARHAAVVKELLPTDEHDNSANAIFIAHSWQDIADLLATVDVLVEALNKLDDYFDLGIVLFHSSNRFEHAQKLIKDALASVQEGKS